MNKFRILHLLASDRLSGAESVVCDIITNTSSSFEHIYCSIDGPIRDVLSSKNITFIPIKKLNFKNVRNVVDKYKPNIIQAHDFRASIIAGICKKNSKLISHIHNNSLWLRKICLKSILFLYSSLKSNKILVVSSAVKEEYVFKKIIEKKIICIDNPVIREKVLSKINWNDKKNNYDICCIARISDAKDPFKFLNVVKDLATNHPKIKVIWVGNGELKDEVIAKCKKMYLNNNIKFIGFQKNPYKYLNQSKIFLLTSKWEGYGLVAFEALTLGKPCVVSNVGGLKNIVDNNCGKLCDNKGIKDYVDEINVLLTNSNYYKNKSKKAIEKSLLLENKEKYFEKLESIYSDILK